MALLCLLTGLKLLEARDVRGYAVTCMLMYFLVSVTFGYENSSLAMLILITYCMSTTACLYLLFQPDATPDILNTKSLIKENGKIFLKALPLTLIIFFLFPRIQGDFGFLPDDDRGGKPGFGDSMDSGSMSSRAFSKALAFRAEFPELAKPPSNEKLYWRSKVFDVENNFSWSSQQNNSSLQSSSDNTIRYNVIHQASKDTSIPALEQLLASSRGIVSNDNTIKLKKPLEGATTYQAASDLSVSNTNNKPSNLNRYLQTSYKPKRKTRALIKKWQASATTPEQLVQNILNHFANEPFKYHLQPPALNPRSPIENFLFDSQTGYCEHYASVFTTLMRWQGVPARVVIGFQGGDWNAVGEFLEVRYSDAHAWSEVWLENKGWTRVDPTFAIAPERIELGMDAMLALMDGNESEQKLSDILQPSGASKAWNKMNNFYHSLNHKWDKWVVNFNQKRQLEILESLKLGKEDATLKLLGIMFTLCGLFAAYILYRLLPKRSKLSEMDKLYRRFTKKLKSKGIEPVLGEGAISFSQRAAKQLPEKKRVIISFAKLYTIGKYGKAPISLKHLQQQLRETINQL